MPTLANEPPSTSKYLSLGDRKVRNFLIHERFQLKFAAYIVGLTLLVSGLLGAFLWRITTILFREMAVAVEARSRAAEQSRELGNAVLSNELMAKMNDPSFESQLRARSASIDLAYQAEAAAIEEARARMVRREQVTLLGLVGALAALALLVGLGTIAATHRIAGPLHRLQRIAMGIAEGKLSLSTHGPRPRDELPEMSEAFFAMVKALRARAQADLVYVQRAKTALERGSAAELQGELTALEGRLSERLAER